MSGRAGRPRSPDAPGPFKRTTVPGTAAKGGTAQRSRRHGPSARSTARAERLPVLGLAWARHLGPGPDDRRGHRSPRALRTMSRGTRPGGVSLDQRELGDQGWTILMGIPGTLRRTPTSATRAPAGNVHAEKREQGVDEVEADHLDAVGVAVRLRRSSSRAVRRNTGELAQGSVSNLKPKGRNALAS